ncbi:hypothetical protein L202_06347 [Cryptococcus amylolentus CBS 6039]|uniref:Uncharacterized protein n=2 Tax=Cryptococcus amylolentus TaxID=104669 RepID=A0A1E3HFM5_9TREE|nr:hypothetical protein L202_06347 [Cryptococcus amylolentus CBS 6039]ODN75142.1 hypothetical protein L202_06347 [Cryptococcus amylolentus CBS 6039]ODO02930.1 hypothetical protein I350_05772 [Cryptococcus amylolentus CBS 6273]
MATPSTSPTTTLARSTHPSSHNPQELVLHLRAYPASSSASSSDLKSTPRTSVDPPPPSSQNDGSITLYATSYLTRGASVLPTTAGDGLTMLDRFIPPAGKHGVVWRVDDDTARPSAASVSKAEELESLLKERYEQCSRTGHQLEPFLKGSFAPLASGNRSTSMSYITKAFDRTLKEHGTEVAESVYGGFEGKDRVGLKCVLAGEFEKVTGERLERLDMGEYSRALKKGQGVLGPQPEPVQR